MPKKPPRNIQRNVKSTRGRKPNIPDEEWVHDYPIVILPMVSRANRTKVVGYEVYALNLPNLGTVRTRSLNIQAAFSTMRKRIDGYLADCRKAKDGKGRPIKPTPPTLRGDLIPVALSDDLTKRMSLFAEIEAEALHDQRQKDAHKYRARGERSKVSWRGLEMEWTWGTSAQKVADRFEEKHPNLPEASTGEVVRARRKAEYRSLVFAIKIDKRT
jgi:hypothetical protein